MEQQQRKVDIITTTRCTMKRVVINIITIDPATMTQGISIITVDPATMNQGINITIDPAMTSQAADIIIQVIDIQIIDIVIAMIMVVIVTIATTTTRSFPFSSDCI
jgi:hypothetical protein